MPLSEVSLNLKPRKYRLRTSASLPKFPTDYLVVHTGPGERRPWVQFPQFPLLGFYQVGHTSGLENSTSVVTLPGAGHGRVSAGLVGLVSVSNWAR